MARSLQDRIERISGMASDPLEARRDEALQAVADLRAALNSGEVRAAGRESTGRWIVHEWVKRGILLGFKIGAITD